MNDEFAALVRRLEHHPDLYGRRVADVPQLAVPRLRYRRNFYRWSTLNFGAAIFNFWLAASQLVTWFWPINALAAGLSFYMALFSEGRARALTRQLRRPAALQVALDLVGADE
jgi:hypothetical protein